MNSAATNSGKEKLKIFEMVLCSPGMNEKCKISLPISRQNILLLSRLIEAGFLSDKRNFDDEIISSLPTESLEEFRVIHQDILKKADLTEFYEKLKLL